MELNKDQFAEIEEAVELIFDGLERISGVSSGICLAAIKSDTDLPPQEEIDALIVSAMAENVYENTDETGDWEGIAPSWHELGLHEDYEYYRQQAMFRAFVLHQIARIEFSKTEKFDWFNMLTVTASLDGIPVIKEEPPTSGERDQ